MQQLELPPFPADLSEALTWALKHPSLHLISRIPGRDGASMGDIVRALEDVEETINVLLVTSDPDGSAALSRELGGAEYETVLVADTRAELREALSYPNWTIVAPLGLACRLSHGELQERGPAVVIADGLGERLLSYEFNQLRRLFAGIPCVVTHHGLPELCPSQIRYLIGDPGRPGGFLYIDDGREDVPVFVERAAGLKPLGARSIAEDIRNRVGLAPPDAKLVALVGQATHPKDVESLLRSMGVGASAAGGTTDMDVFLLSNFAQDPECRVHIRRARPPYVGITWHQALVYDKDFSVYDANPLTSQMRSAKEGSTHSEIVLIGGAAEVASRVTGFRAQRRG